MVQAESNSDRQGVEASDTNSNEELYREGNAQLETINVRRRLLGKRYLTKLPGPPDPNRFNDPREPREDENVAFTIRGDKKQLKMNEVDDNPDAGRRVDWVSAPQGIHISIGEDESINVTRR